MGTQLYVLGFRGELKIEVLLMVMGGFSVVGSLLEG